MRLDLRRLWARDAPAVLAHYRRLDPTSRRRRFFAALDDTALAERAALVGSPELPMVGGFDGAEVRALGELSLAGDGTAEMALSVEPAWRGQGVGTAIVRRLIEKASNRGVRRVVARCLDENRAMQQLARRVGAAIRNDAGELEGTIGAPPATWLSLLDECTDDGWALARLAGESLIPPPSDLVVVPSAPWPMLAGWWGRRGG